MTKSGAIRTAFFLRVIFVLYKNFFVVYSKIKHHPFPSGFSPATQLGTILYKS